MKTLEITNGDLVVGPQGFTTISNVSKTRQDLHLALVEVYGNDRFHPRWGSLLDQFIGRSDIADLEFYIQAEVQRVVSNYVAVQADLIEQDMRRGEGTRFATSEIVRGVEDITVITLTDRVDVAVKLKTVSGNKISVRASSEA